MVLNDYCKLSTKKQNRGLMADFGLRRKGGDETAALQKAANGVAKGCLLQRNRPPFTMRKAAYWNTVYNCLAVRSVPVLARLAAEVVLEALREV